MLTPTIMQGFRDELVKVALNKVERMMASGDISPEQMAHEYSTRGLTSAGGKKNIAGMEGYNHGGWEGPSVQQGRAAMRQNVDPLAAREQLAGKVRDRNASNLAEVRGIQKKDFVSGKGYSDSAGKKLDKAMGKEVEQRLWGQTAQKVKTQNTNEAVMHSLGDRPNLPGPSNARPPVDLTGEAVAYHGPVSAKAPMPPPMAAGGAGGVHLGLAPPRPAFSAAAHVPGGVPAAAAHAPASPVASMLKSLEGKVPAAGVEEAATKGVGFLAKHKMPLAIGGGLAAAGLLGGGLMLGHNAGQSTQPRY